LKIEELYLYFIVSLECLFVFPFWQAQVADGSKLLVEVPDGTFRVELYQNTQMTPLVTDTNIAVCALVK
jgi:hypothetical protein